MLKRDQITWVVGFYISGEYTHLPGSTRIYGVSRGNQDFMGISPKKNPTWLYGNEKMVGDWGPPLSVCWFPSGWVIGHSCWLHLDRNRFLFGGWTDDGWCDMTLDIVWTPTLDVHDSWYSGNPWLSIFIFWDGEEKTLGKHVVVLLILVTLNS